MGGYVDNSGALAAGVVLDRLLPLVAEDNAGGTCIVPILVQIDNGAENLIPGGIPNANPSQLLVPATGWVASGNAGASVAKVGAAALVLRPLEDAEGRTIVVTTTDDGEPFIRYVRIFPVAQAGNDASLGWLLSDVSKDVLETQVAASITVGDVFTEPGEAPGMLAVGRCSKPPVRAVSIGYGDAYLLEVNVSFVLVVVLREESGPGFDR